jgi:hypothetical protein
VCQHRSPPAYKKKRPDRSKQSGLDE